MSPIAPPQDGLAYVRRYTEYEYAIDRSSVEPTRDRRWLVIGENDKVRKLREYGVYVFFDGDRCLYVGESSPKILVGRALDYLWEQGGRTWLYRIVRHHADRLFIIPCGKDDDLAGLRMEAHLIGLLQPVLNETALFATPTDRERYGITVTRTKRRSP